MKTPTRNIALSLALPILGLSLQVNAAEFNYDYVEAAFAKSDVEFGSAAIEDSSLNGFNVNASYTLQPNIVIGGGYTAGSGKTNANLQFQGENGVVRDRIKVDATAISVFALYHNAINHQADYQAGVEITKTDSEWTNSRGGEITGLSQDETSKAIFGGVRFQFNEQLELNLNIEYDLDADDGDDEISFGLGAQYRINPTIDVGVRFEPDDNGDTIGVSIRKYL